MTIRCHRCKVDAEEDEMTVQYFATGSSSRPSRQPVWICRDLLACEIRIAAQRPVWIKLPCPNGHPATEVYRRRKGPKAGSIIYCKACKREKQREVRAAKAIEKEQLPMLLAA